MIRVLLTAFAVLVLAASTANAEGQLRIGYQRSSTLIALLRQHGALEDALAHLKVAEQQKIADAFHAEGLLPRPVDAAALPIWEPPTR